MANQRVRRIISQMTLEEKAGLLSGFDYWSTKAVERLGIPSLPMADGPHGLRKQKANELGMERSYPSTCFPTAALLACSWDEELAEKQGQAIGREARGFGLSCVLGPGINIKRSPLCGRNFEYFSEDPLLSGRMGAGVVNGLQSEGVSACLKHFAVNNQEDYRFWVDARVDERTLREIYLASFEYALAYCKPKAFMCSYNKINGTYASENKWLLTDVLRDEWGFDGPVMSDWGAVNNRVSGVKAGLDLEMPGSFGVNDAEIVKAVKSGDLEESEVDICVERMLEFVFGLEHTLEPVPCDSAPHHELAREIAAESMVLLENNGILPLRKGINVAVVGDIAVNPVYQGGGSSRIVPTKVDIPLECIGEYANATYVKGDSFGAFSEGDIQTIRDADAVVVFTGMPDHFDTEGSDRTGMRLPEEQYELINEIYFINANTAVVLCVGAPVETPDITPALLMSYLGGQAMGGAVADLLFGVKNPCGKLAETFPCVVQDTPSYMNFPGDGTSVMYGEGVHVGYRWYGRYGRRLRTLYDFGHGLSYTKFKYRNLKATEKEVSVEVANIGHYDGKEVVQVYINGELKGFKKVFVKSGESQTVTVELTPRSFSYWNVDSHDWRIKGGEYKISVGRLTETVTLGSTEPVPKVDLFTQVRQLYFIPNARELLDEVADKAGVIVSEELINTKDCSSFVGNMLRNLVTMFDYGWTFAELNKKIAQINEANGYVS